MPTLQPTPFPTTTPAPTHTPWFLINGLYYKYAALAATLGLIVATALATLFRLRLGRWPPFLRAAASAVAVASVGSEVVYATAAADSSGQFCGRDCPSDAGWVIIIFSFLTCGTLLVYRLNRLRLALEVNAALGYAFAHGCVVFLAAVDGDLLVWLPWTETNATRALAGFPDGSSIAFTTWCMLLRKFPFLVWTITNVVHSDDGPSPMDVLTLSMTGTSLAMSLSTKFLRRLAFANTDLDVFVGVQRDARSSRGIDSSAQNLLGVPLLQDEKREGSGGGGGDGGAGGNDGGDRGFVGVEALSVSSSGSFQNMGAIVTGGVITVLVVTGSIPEYSDIMRVGEFVLAGIGGVLALFLVISACKVLYTAALGCSQRQTIRTSIFEALQIDLEQQQRAAEERERAFEVERRAAEERLEAQRNQEEYMKRYVLSETGLDVEKAVMPLDVVKKLLAGLSPRIASGTASDEDKREVERLMNMLSANPDQQKEIAAARAAFLADEEDRNAEARRVVRTHIPAAAKGVLSAEALERIGVSTAVARRFTRLKPLMLIVTPDDEIATMLPSVLLGLSPQLHSVLEIRAIVASLPKTIKNDTATGEKRAWVDKWVDALQAKLADEAAGRLKPNELRHPCYEIPDACDGSSSTGPFDGNTPLVRRPEAVKSTPMSGAAAAEEAAAVAAAGRVTERQSALLGAGLGRAGVEAQEIKPPPPHRSSSSTGIASLRERRASSTAAPSVDGGSLLAGIAAAAARRDARAHEGKV